MNSRGYLLTPVALLITISWLALIINSNYSMSEEVIFLSEIDDSLLLKTAIETDLQRVIESELKLQANLKNIETLDLKQKVNNAIFSYLIQRKAKSNTNFFLKDSITGFKVPLTREMLSENSFAIILQPRREIFITEYHFTGGIANKNKLAVKIEFSNGSIINALISPGFYSRKVVIFE